MTAAQVLANLQRDGVILRRNGDRLAFDAPAGAMTSKLRALLTHYKPELLALLRGDYLAAAASFLSNFDTDRAAELADQFDERSGICQFDGNMVRSEAERVAYLELAKDTNESVPLSTLGETNNG